MPAAHTPRFTLLVSISNQPRKNLDLCFLRKNRKVYQKRAQMGLVISRRSHAHRDLGPDLAATPSCHQSALVYETSFVPGRRARAAPRTA